MKIYSLLSLIVFMSQGAHAVKLANIEGWKAIDVKTDKALASIFSGSEQILLVTAKDAETAPIVSVRTLGPAPKNLKTVTDWNKAVFADSTESRVVTAQRLITKKGQRQYIAEFQTDIGTETMLHSVLLATDVGGKLRILIYEQRRDSYRESLPLVRKLFQNVTLAGD